MRTDDFRPQKGDALIIVDLQKDFLPGGSLAVPRGDEVISPLNQAIDVFRENGLPIFATRDWHPSDHCSFQAQGGPWPPHCVARTPGSEFASDLRLPESAIIVSKAMTRDRDAYSGFQDTDLHAQLQQLAVSRIFVGGLATDYCVLNTVKDGIRLGYRVYLLQDAVRGVNVRSDDEQKAITEMREHGAFPITTAALNAGENARRTA